MIRLFTKERLRVFVSLALAFILCLSIFLVALATTSFLATGKSFVLNSVKASKYTEYAYSELVQKLNELAVPSGLPDNFFDDKISFDEFEGLFYACLQNTLVGNKNFSTDYKSVEESILKHVTDFSVNEIGQTIEINDASLQIFASECINIYSSFINPPLANYLFSLFSTVRKYLIIATVVLLILCLTAGCILFKINDTSHFKKYCFSSVAGASLTIGVIPGILVATNEISKLTITSESLHSIITCFISHFLWLMVISAILLAVISIIILTFKTKCLIFRR